MPLRPEIAQVAFRIQEPFVGGDNVLRRPVRQPGENHRTLDCLDHVILNDDHEQAHAVEDLGDCEFAFFKTTSDVVTGMRWYTAEPALPIDMYVDFLAPHPQGWNALARALLQEIGLTGPEAEVMDNDGPLTLEDYGPAMPARYGDLRPGDLFRFNYPHHGEAPFRPVWRKLEVGFQRHDGREWRPDLAASDSMPLERLTPKPNG